MVMTRPKITVLWSNVAVISRNMKAFCLKRCFLKFASCTFSAEPLLITWTIVYYSIDITLAKIKLLFLLHTLICNKIWINTYSKMKLSDIMSAILIKYFYLRLDLSF